MHHALHQRKVQSILDSERSHIQRHISGIASTHRIINNNVQPSQRVYAALDSLLPIFKFRDIAFERHSGAFGQRVGHLLPIGFVDLKQEDFAAFVNEFARDAFAQAKSGAGDDGDFLLEAAGVGHFVREKLEDLKRGLDL